MAERARLGAEIRAMRVGAKLTQQQLGERCSVPQCNIAKLECGKYNASIDVLTRIASALDAELTIKKI